MLLMSYRKVLRYGDKIGMSKKGDEGRTGIDKHNESTYAFESLLLEEHDKIVSSGN